MIRRLVQLGVAAGTATAAVVLGSAVLSRPCSELPPRSTDTVTAVVLGGGSGAGGAMLADSRRRTDAAVGLFAAGVVSRLHFTGTAGPWPVPTARAMQTRAIAAGVPATATTIETESRSTLENALFSAPLLPEGRLLLVSDGFHLWRGAASMAWAGKAVDATCRAARPTAPGDGRGEISMMLREMAAWWVNIGRAGAWSLASLLGIDGALPDGFLE